MNWKKLLAGMGGVLSGAGVGLFGVGIVAAGLAHTERRAAQARNPQQAFTVMAEDLPAGQVLTYDHLAQRQLPAPCATSDDLVDPDEAEDLAAGRVLAVPVKRGELLRVTHLAEKVKGR